MRQSGPLDEDELPAAVAAGAATALSEDVSVNGLERLEGGASGLTYRAELARRAGSTSLVVKVAPPGLTPVGNRDVLRQASILEKLGGSRVPVPRVLFTCAGNGRLPPLYATEFVEGDACEPIFDEPGCCSDEEIRRQALLHAASLLAELHQVPPTAVLPDSEHPVTPAAEVERWVRAFDSVPPDLRFDGPRLGRALAARVPEPIGPVLVHGDFRLGNMIARAGSIRAVLDWEICAVSDPRIDVAWFATQADAGSHPLTRWQPPGMPAAATLVDTYEAARGIRLGQLSWFTALMRFKTAATSALIVKHARRGGSDDGNRARWGAGIGPLTVDGLRILEEEL